MKNHASKTLGCLFAVLLASASVQAQTTGSSPPKNSPHMNKAPAWKDLSKEQQAELGPKASDRWDQLPDARKQKILERHKKWESLPPEQRTALRDAERNFQQMSPEQKQKMRESMRRVKSLPPEQRQQLRQKWLELTPEQRRQWLEAGGPGTAPSPNP